LPYCLLVFETLNLLFYLGMKHIFKILIVILLVLPGCKYLINDPLIILVPTIGFQGHIRNNQVYITSTIQGNPDYVVTGNGNTRLAYEGMIDFYNQSTGELIESQDISGEGLNCISTASASAEAFDNMIVIVSGTVSAYVDYESDDDPTNDVFISSSEFYQEALVSDVVTIEDYPVVIMSPAVDFQLYIRNKELYTTATISANPDYQTTGYNSIVFKHEGVLQVYDVTSGALLKSSSLAGTGYTNAVTVLTDTTSFSGFIIIASGTITCNEDIENDGVTSNDRFISSADFYEVLEVDLTE